MIFLGVYRDWAKAIHTINRLLEHTNEQILIRSDGDYDNKLASQLLQRNRVLLVRGKRRLKVVGSGGLYTHNWLSLFLQFSRDSYLIKIDPDTGVNHAPNLPSDNFDVACNYVDGSLRGGAIAGGKWLRHIAFARRAVQKIVGLQVLFDHKYKPLRWCYRWRKTQWIPCEDAILYDVIQRLGLKLVHWDDVYCRHSEETFSPTVPLENYSLYHPL